MRCLINSFSLFCKFLVFLVIPSLFIGCDRVEPVFPFKFIVNNWDTAFTIKTLHFPDSVLYNKSIVNVGNTYRLRCFYNSIKTKQFVKIGFIGGSITQGYSSSLPENSYAQRFCTFLKNQYPENKFAAVNAGISGTDSRFGCSRIEDDLLSKKPDMVVIEFTVNDDLLDAERTSQIEEGLVRRCLKETDGPVIYLLLTDSAGHASNQQVDSTIGCYYGIPVLSYQKVCMPELQNGNLSWSDITADVIHPNDKGHLILSYLLYAFIKSCLNNYNHLDNTPLQIPVPLRSSIFENADIYKKNDTSITLKNSGWAETVTEYGRKSFVSSKTGSTLTLNCNIHELTLGYRLMSNHTGQMEISINDIPFDTITENVGEYVYTNLYQKTVFLDTNEVHPKKITLKTLNNQYFELTYLMFAR